MSEQTAFVEGDLPVVDNGFDARTMERTRELHFRAWFEGVNIIDLIEALNCWCRECGAGTFETDLCDGCDAGSRLYAGIERRSLEAAEAWKTDRDAADWIGVSRSR